MAKIEVPYDRYVREMLRVLNESGILLVSLDQKGRANAMAIGWAQIGIIWGRQILNVMVRPSRYTHGCIEATRDFTVCVPYEEQREAVNFCGSTSGRDHDKFKECGLTATPGQTVKSPYIEECGLCYECRVVNSNDFLPDDLAPDVCSACYLGGDYHRVYFGEILRVVADEDFEKRLGSQRSPE